jgi:hypothetical protein
VAVAGVVDDDVQAAEMLVGVRHRGKGRFAVGDIEGQREQRVAVLGPQVVQCARVTGCRGDAVAAIQGGRRPLATKAARRTGDEPCLVSHGAEPSHTLGVADQAGEANTWHRGCN